jgi:hypothetical protein
MKPTVILLTGLILLVIVFSFVAYVQVALFFSSAITVALFLWAFVMHRRGLREFSLKLPQPDEPEAAIPMLVIQGKEFKPTAYAVIKGQLTVANVPLLAGTFLLALAIFCIVPATTGFTQQIDINTSLYFVFYAIAYFSVIPLLIAGRFWFECRLLAGAGVTLGLIQRHLRGTGGSRQIQYEFRGPGGEYLGDTSANYSGTDRDNAVLIFFNPPFPALNKAAPSLFFHRVDLSRSN